MKEKENLSTCLVNKEEMSIRNVKYNMNLNRKYFKNYFVRATDNSHLSICNYCGKKGHISHAYFARKSNRMKTKWKFKNRKAKRPTQLWVSKIVSRTMNCPTTNNDRFKVFKLERVQIQLPTRRIR